MLCKFLPSQGLPHNNKHKLHCLSKLSFYGLPKIITLDKNILRKIVLALKSQKKNSQPKKKILNWKEKFSAQKKKNPQFKRKILNSKKKKKKISKKKVKRKKSEVEREILNSKENFSTQKKNSQFKKKKKL